MKIGGIIELSNLTLYTITSLKDQPGSAAKILTIFANEKVNLEYITEGTCQKDLAVISFCVDSDDDERVDQIIRSLVEKESLAIKKQEYVSILGIYGPHFREKPAIAAHFCSTLGQAEINILGISSSISTISCVIDVREMEKAREALLKHFELP